ncbi:MAG: aspartate transaminase, partial [Armatimonadota bacterium]|nr:aspartate transaminase [Armatimonadota bacterium]
VVPGSGFGADANIRLSYATSMPNIEKGLARIAAAVRALR